MTRFLSRLLVYVLYLHAAAARAASLDTLLQPVAMAFRVASLMQKAPKSWSQAGARLLGTAASAPAEVVVVGSNIIDMTAYTPRLPQLGETVLGHQFQRGFGGKVCLALGAVVWNLLNTESGRVTLFCARWCGRGCVTGFRFISLGSTGCQPVRPSRNAGCANRHGDDGR